MKKIIRITESKLIKLIKESIEVEEMLGYEDFQTSEGLQELRDAIDKNKFVTVAFVKEKDGNVRHMLIRKSLSSYVGSDREKSEKQANVEMNNNIKRVVDYTTYTKLVKSGEDKEIAAKKSWRSFKLANVLGFLVNGKFKDLRDENEIMDRFGEQVYNSLTKSMVNAMDRERQEIENQVGDDTINEGEGFFGNFGRWFNKPTTKDAADDALKSQGYSQMGRDDSDYGEEHTEDNYYTVFNGQKFYPDQIEYADNYDMGKIPRVEGDKLIIANPRWED